jgi:hypothetical protein
MPEDNSPRDAAETTDDAEQGGETDPVQAIFDIIDRYYEGVEREDEGMGVD